MDSNTNHCIFSFDVERRNDWAKAIPRAYVLGAMLTSVAQSTSFALDDHSTVPT